MKKQELNMTLNRVIEEWFATSDEAALKKASESVRTRYRDDAAKNADLRIRTGEEAQGYLAWRFPVTAMVIQEVMSRLKERLPDFQPETVLDLGAGPAVSVMPLASHFPALKKITLVEAQPAMQEAGHGILQQFGQLVPPGLEIEEVRGSFLDARLPRAELVLASYALNELTPDEIGKLSVRLDESAARAAVLIVPGTPQHFRKLLTARNRLLEKGFRIIAPCTFTGGCHMEDETDWCHFYERVQRSSLLRRLKEGELAYEDEKFSYLIVVREGLWPEPEAGAGVARIIRHPMIFKGRREVTLCHETGITMIQFTKRRHPTTYRDLRSRGWGDLLTVDVFDHAGSGK